MILERRDMGRALLWVAALILSLSAESALADVGFQVVSVPDPRGPPLEVGIWYPSDAPASPQPLGLFQQVVATDGAVAGRGLPLVVMSHGTGGAFSSHYDTALALAEAGFVVAAVTHTGDNYRDSGSFSRIWERPRHIKVLTDYLLEDWPRHDVIDPARIGIFGFSAGGFSALVAIGANPDLSHVTSHCAEHPHEWACAKLKDAHVDPSLRLIENIRWTHDPRIAAAVIVAPAASFTLTPAGLADVKVPIQLWCGDRDTILPHPYFGQVVSDALPNRPEYHLVANAGHVAFLAPCSAALASAAPEGCRDPPGFDREAFHREFNANVLSFFRAHLPPGRTK
jgi:predicted dienelactone hydrolase